MKMTNGLSKDTKKVGYKNPPDHTKFPKGKSGNPSGRPKGSKSLKTKVAELLDKEISFQTEAGLQTMTIREAQAHKIQEFSLKGDIRYTRLIIDCEDEFTIDNTDMRSKGEKDAECIQRAIANIFFGPDDLEGFDEDGNCIDSKGNIHDAVETAKSLLAEHDKKEQ